MSSSIRHLFLIGHSYHKIRGCNNFQIVIGVDYLFVHVYFNNSSDLQTFVSTTTAKALRLRRFSALAWDVLVFADATTDDDSAWLGAAPGPGALFHHI